MVMTITEMRELKEQKGYTLEEIAEKSGIDIELAAKIFYKKEQIGQKEFYDLLTYSEIRELEKVFVEADKNKAAEALGAYQVKKQGEYTLEDYYALPDDQRYELIDGVLYDMAAPLPLHIRRLLSRLRWLCGNISKIKVENVKCLCHRLMYSWIRMIRRWCSRMFF